LIWLFFASFFIACSPGQESSTPAVKVLPDYDAISALQSRFDAYEADSSVAKVSHTASVSDHTIGFTPLTQPGEIFQFESIDDYELMLSVVSVSHELHELTFAYYPALDTLRSIWGLGHPDLHWLNHEGKVIIGDTLYTLSSDRQIKESLSTGVSVTLFPQAETEALQTNKSQSTNSGSIKELFPDKEDRAEYYFVAIGKDNNVYDVRVICRNKKVNTLGVRLAIAETSVGVKRSDRENYNETDAAQVGPVKVVVQMKSRYTILLKGCQTRTNTASETGLSAKLNTGRCPDNDPTSLHWAALLNGTYPIVAAEAVE
jgi:hypothetical protein